MPVRETESATLNCSRKWTRREQEQGRKEAHHPVGLTAGISLPFRSGLQRKTLSGKW
jgi:hypothetical protein